MDNPIPYPRIEADKINKPIQLMAVWFAVLVLTNASLLLAITHIDDTRIRYAFSGAVIVFVFFFAILVFLIQTRYRPVILDDASYLKYAEMNTPRRVESQIGTAPGAVYVNDAPPAGVRALPATRDTTLFEELDQKAYPSIIAEQYFLLHSAETIRPERAQGGSVQQPGLYRVRIWLESYQAQQLQECETVYYRLYSDDGEDDFEENVVVTHALKKQFELWLNAYGEFNIVAVAVLKNKERIWLTRYLDLPGRPIA